MSIWTQINGSVTIRDDFPGMEEISYDDIKEVFGKTCSYGSSDDIWDECTVPCGSEGSLQYKINHVDSVVHVDWVVSIFGALRDYDNVEEIEEWFKGIVLKTSMSIREATLYVRVENSLKNVGVVFVMTRNIAGERVVTCLKE